jgi:hypothetical protein
MSTGIWVLIYLAVSLTYKWIISWGGADYIKGWKSIFFFNGTPEGYGFIHMDRFYHFICHKFNLPRI